MIQPSLPYRDTDCQPETPSTALHELHALRDAYARKAVAVLERHFTGKWQEFVDDTCRFPLRNTDGIAVLVAFIEDLTDWAIVTRFSWLAQKCWEAELAEFCHRHFEHSAAQKDVTNGSDKAA